MGKTFEIRSFRGAFYFLSNFYPCAIRYDGLEYRNLEAAFQAAKCTSLPERIPFQSMDASAAKKHGRTVSLRSNWEHVKLSILTELIRTKFVGNPELFRNLLATGDARLSEDNTWHDNFYGNCVCPRCRNIPGCNHLGHTLMRLREQLRNSAGRDNPMVIKPLPDGRALVAETWDEPDYPGIRISLRTDGNHDELLCFAEHSCTKPAGKELCIAVYAQNLDEPVYYESYSDPQAPSPNN